MTRFGLLLLALPASAALTTPAQAACTDEQASAYRRVPSALDAWQARSGIAISAPFRHDIARAFCASASALLANGRTNGDIDAATAPALFAYLDAYAGDGDAQTVDAALRSQLGASGMARPVFRTYGKLELVQVHPVDAFRLGAQALPVALASSPRSAPQATSGRGRECDNAPA